MIGRTAPAVLIVAVIALSGSGCGSSTLSARALRTQARRLCAAAIRRSDRIAMPGSNGGGATFLAHGITIFRSELGALRKLAPPRALVSAYRTSLGDSAQQLDALIATHHDLVHGDDPVVAIKQLEVELTAINSRDRDAWRATGVPACANQQPNATA